ncbi:dicarboxylate/amino acid:cation symporter [Camelliibacillus cellulosilyticus]|uniref:Dicarboxylate/amino acid:cation symporter n=1 Tax=Camelliibacillus cellulosilyticus TaxID=2174486 RepID=A0ABV9GQX8_9BACL
MGMIWRRYLDISLVWKIIVALILGVIAGFLFGPNIAVIKPLGDLLIRLLMFLILPLILFTLIIGFNQSRPQDIGRMGIKVIVYYMVTSIVAICVGILIGTIFQPGAGFTLPAHTKVNVTKPPSFIEFLIDIVPDNIVTAFGHLDLLSIIFTAVVFGLAIASLRQSDKYRSIGQMLFEVTDGLNEATMKIMRWVLEYVPVGVFAIIANTIGHEGGATLTSLGKLIGVIYIGLIIQLIFYSFLLAIYRRSPLAFFNQVREVMLTAFVTQSSLGTLPFSLEAAKRMGIKKSLYGFSLPLGATINMDGAAIRFGASAVFAANVAQQSLTFTMIVMIVLTGTLASVGTAGVPGAGLITISAILIQAGLPVEAAALMSAIDAIVGMGCTCVNVTGDLVCTNLVHQSETFRRKIRSANEESE